MGGSEIDDLRELRVYPPTVVSSEGRSITIYPGGLTLRDYFAAAVLPVVMQRAICIMDDTQRITASAASLAYAVADKMMEMRKK